jgi:hypothetical protein
MIRSGAVAAAVLVASIGSAVGAAGAQGGVDGCLNGNVCGYVSRQDLALGNPRTSDVATAVGHYSLFDGAEPAVLVEMLNNSPHVVSEGRFVLAVPRVLCRYVPDGNDVQNSGAAQILTDHKPIDAIAVATSAAAARSTVPVALDNCGPH